MLVVVLITYWLENRYSVISWLFLTNYCRFLDPYICLSLLVVAILHWGVISGFSNWGYDGDKTEDTIGYLLLTIWLFNIAMENKWPIER